MQIQLPGRPGILVLSILAMAAIAPGQERVATDEVADGHLFMTVASTPVGAEPASAQAIAQRQAAYVKHIGLNPSQGNLLTQVAEKYREYLSNLNERATGIAGLPTRSHCCPN